jgi:calcium-dependent protein kinase
MGFCVSKEHRTLPPYAKPISPSEATVPSVLFSSTSYTDVQQAYTFKKVLGHGQFGTVREAVAVRGQRSVAIKSVSKEKVKKDLYLLRRELEVMRQIDHPNVIKYFETYEDEKYIHIVMELCSGGDLLDKLINLGTLTESYVASIMKSLLLAVNHLHSLGICHRDLKPENFLFENSQPDSLIKIIDFGMSIKQTNLTEMTSLVGTPYYLAPEVIRGKYGLECDIWSLGVVMYFLLSGTPPFDGDDMSDIFKAIRRADLEFDDRIWRHISDSAIILIKEMLIKRPSDRISIVNAIKHPWFDQQSSHSPHPVTPSVLNSLKMHKTPKKLQLEVMKVMIKFLSSEDIEELRQAFLELDQEKSGFISVSDLEKAMDQVGFSMQLEEIRSKA